jgi:hypothetical protein
MKRFQINTPVLFTPPNPSKTVGALLLAGSCPTFARFFQDQFGGNAQNLTDNRCTQFLGGLKRCFESNPENAANSCAYYIDGFKRMSCAVAK